MNREIPEYLEEEWQTAKDEYKVKTTSYITITKFEYEKLQQENKQLKEMKLDAIKETSQMIYQRDKYKFVLDEIRGYIKEHKEYLEKAKEMYINCDDELLKSTCIQLINNELVKNDDLLQILDKVKE